MTNVYKPHPQYYWELDINSYFVYHNAIFTREKVIISNILLHVFMLVVHFVHAELSNAAQYFCSACIED